MKTFMIVASLLVGLCLATAAQARPRVGISVNIPIVGLCAPAPGCVYAPPPTAAVYSQPTPAVNAQPAPVVSAQPAPMVYIQPAPVVCVPAPWRSPVPTHTGRIATVRR
jgi:hypothetical protein